VTLQYLHALLDELLSLDKGVQKQLKKKLDETSRIPFEGFAHQALKGDQFKGLYKLRVGDWRLIYKIDEGVVLFVTLGHRSEVYG
jgi:addiction module RelE/StbE family toxin